jgi:hypothetical protein
VQNLPPKIVMQWNDFHLLTTEDAVATLSL